MSQSQPPEELEELIPWHLNGTLGDRGQRRMEQLLARNPGSRRDLALHEEVASAMRLEHRSYDEQGTLMGLLTRLGPTTAKAVRSRRDTAGKSRFDALFSWCEPKLGFAVVTIAIQAIVIGTLVHQPNQPQLSDIRSQTQVSEAVQPIYRVTFAPSAAERDIRSLLRAAHAYIIHGPTQLGDYYLAPVGSHTLASETVLRQSKLVDSINRVDRIPTQ